MSMPLGSRSVGDKRGTGEMPITPPALKPLEHATLASGKRA